LYHGRNGRHSLIELKEVLGLKNMPVTIEAVDISLTAGTNPVGSLVVFKYGEPYKSGYRKFKIESVEGTDDYAMVAEVVRRRYTRLSKERQTMPDLLVIDGGKGQVNAAYGELEKLGITVKIIGITKKNEEIWFSDRNKPLVLSRHSQALQLIQRLRDESHRFAQRYHKLLRSKTFHGKK
jgi:excinuclease ABC subunit C